ncbi:MAG: oligosaccharide flippase family protein [Candidatus Electryoneaceae bacterium]|nr:oligosaccharide flippase family protein [Candidatus Electryoneaceae bacterium]
MNQTSLDNPTQRDNESLIVKLVAAFTGQFGTFLLALGTQIVIARTLGPTGKGMFSLTLLVANIIVAFAHGSLSNANSHFIGRHPESRSALVGNSFFLAFVWGAIVTLAAMKWGDDLCNRFVPDIDRHLFGMAMIAIIPLLLFEFSNGLVMGLNLMRRFSATLILREGLVLGGVGSLAYFDIISVDTAVAVWVSASIIAAVVQGGSAWMRVGWGITVSPKLLKDMAVFSFQSHAANLSTFLRLRFDMFLVAYFLSMTEVGYYSVAVGMIAVLWYIPTAIAQVLIPHISERDDKAGDHLTPLLARLGFSVALVGGTVLGGAGWWLIRFVFGEAFSPAYIPLLLLVPGGVIYSLGKVLAGDLLGRGLPQYAMIISILSLIINISANLFLIPLMGIAGAALSASLTQAFSGLMFLYFFLKHSASPIGDMFLLKKEDFTRLYQSLRRR